MRTCLIVQCPNDLRDPAGVVNPRRKEPRSDFMAVFYKQEPQIIAAVPSPSEDCRH